MSCEWCKSEWTIGHWGVIDDGFCQFLSDKFVKYCFHCGEPLEEPEPLTLEELKRMNVEPKKHWVWIENLIKPDLSAYFRVQPRLEGKWFSCGYHGVGYSFEYCSYGEEWLAYARKPREG